MKQKDLENARDNSEKLDITIILPPRGYPTGFCCIAFWCFLCAFEAVCRHAGTLQILVSTHYFVICMKKFPWHIIFYWPPFPSVHVTAPCCV